MIPGIGVAIVIGVGVYLGLKKLLGDRKKEKEEEIKAAKERRLQLVIKNLQETINAIIERVKNLEEKAQQSDANEKAIQLLKERLTTLQRALQKRKALGI
jgi:cell shape-determining protein MreC